jgi:hypothetical protein
MQSSPRPKGIGRQQPKTRTRRSGRAQPPCCWVPAWLRSVRVAVVVGRRNRSASGPRPHCWTNSAPCRSRLPAGEAWPHVSARRAACSNAQAAIGNATVTNGRHRRRHRHRHPLGFAALAAAAPPGRLGQTMGAAEVGRESSATPAGRCWSRPSPPLPGSPSACSVWPPACSGPPPGQPPGDPPPQPDRQPAPPRTER